MNHYFVRPLFLLIIALAAGAGTARADEPVQPPAAATTTSVAAPAAEASAIPPYQARFGRSRPLIAVVGDNNGTELADFIVPYSILSRSNAAEVLAVATADGALQFRPALKFEPQTTTGQFDQRFPEGADYLIVPAGGKTNTPALLAWIKAQADKGATVVSICDGAQVVARAGLFKGRRATGHWASQSMRERDFPDTQWQKNTRYVVDGKLISSAGISAAVPLSLALVEAIAGHKRAAALAEELGADGWHAKHQSDQFQSGAGLFLTTFGNGLFASQEHINVPVADGVDEIALALTADAFSRTHRSQAYAVGRSDEPIRTRGGLTLLPDRLPEGTSASARLIAVPRSVPPVRALDHALSTITELYGRSTARLVAAQFEYPQ